MSDNDKERLHDLVQRSVYEEDLAYRIQCAEAAERWKSRYENTVNYGTCMAVLVVILLLAIACLMIWGHPPCRY